MSIHLFAFLLVVSFPLPLALLWCPGWLRLHGNPSFIIGMNRRLAAVSHGNLPAREVCRCGPLRRRP